MTDLVFEPGRLTDKYLDELACQYANAANFIALIRAALEQVEETERNLLSIQECFDIERATGACLTAIGLLVGWPRTHCAAQCTAAFGFVRPDDDDPPENILGWFSGDWISPSEGGAIRDYTFVDDELYRKFLKARIAANRSTGTAQEALDAARALLGDEVCLGTIQGGVLEIFVPRRLTSEERSIIELVRRAIPASLASTTRIISSNGPPFGFARPQDPCQPAGWGVGVFAREVETTC